VNKNCFEKESNANCITMVLKHFKNVINKQCSKIHEINTNFYYNFRAAIGSLNETNLYI